MKVDESRQIAESWDRIAPKFDTIYSGRKSTLAQFLDRWLRSDMYQRFAWVMERAGDARGLTACDLGCGSGRFVSALAQKGAQVTGVDFAAQMLQLARELVVREGVAGQCEFVLSSVLEWNTDRQFDFVIAIGFWDYVADPLPLLKRIRGLTRGRFLSAWPRCGTARMYIRKVRLSMAGCPVYFFRRSQVEQLLQQAGFRMISCRTFGQLYCVESIPA